MKQIHLGDIPDGAPSKQYDLQWIITDYDADTQSGDVIGWCGKFLHHFTLNHADNFGPYEEYQPLSYLLEQFSHNRIYVSSRLAQAVQDQFVSIGQIISEINQNNDIDLYI